MSNRWRISSLAVLVAAVASACGGSSGSTTVPPPTVATVAVTIASPLAVGQNSQAQVSVRDASGNAIAGRVVTWTSNAPAIASVSTSGLVTAVAVGAANVTATCEGISGSASVTVLVQGTVPAQVVAVSALSQTGPPGKPVVQAPAVIVRDASNNPVPGISVNFAVTAGGGTIAGGSTSTDAGGVARSSSWTFGPAGAQGVRATVASLASQPVDFAGLSRDPAVHYDITLQFISTMSDSQARAFVDAKERIEQVVVGDVPSQDIVLSASQMASCGGIAVSANVDDLLILAEVGPIDGVGGILAQSGPCYVRSPGTPFPIVGNMKFDTADLAALEASGQLETVILHEMLHVVGFGTIWSTAPLDLLNGAGTADPFFTGTQARANFANLNGGSIYTGTPVPVENSGGAGTRDSHWLDTVFKSELMTGYLSRGTNPLSATTVGSMQDLGYVVDVSRADPFNLATALRATALGAEANLIQMGSDVRPEPPGYIGPDGRPIQR